MAEPFTGEIKMFALRFAPKNWALCDGQEMSIQQNTELYSLLGVAYGGNDTTNFKLPDMRGRVPIHTGSDLFGDYYERGSYGGWEQITLDSRNIPSHTHSMSATESIADQNSLGPNANRVFAQSNNVPLYAANSNDVVSLSLGTSSAAGANQPHNNMQPSIVVNFVIALVGVYPSRN